MPLAWLSRGLVSLVNKYTTVLKEMETMYLRTVFKPYKMKKLNKKLTNLLKESLEDASPVAPIEELKKEAAEFEKMMLRRRNSIH